jgi:alkaline phosphatase D
MSPVSGDARPGVSDPAVSLGRAVDRRSVIRGSLAVGTVAATGLGGAEAANAAPPAFAHGVASGDPLSDRVVIWTRVSGLSREAPVRWTVSRDAAGADVVRRGQTTASPLADYTVKVDVAGLSPNTRYYYAFEVRGVGSPVGRTKTLPVGSVAQLRFAVFSCSNYVKGYFHPYAEAARRDDLDAVIHLGDYIYEYGVTGYPTPALALGLVTQPRIAELDPTTEILALDDYRRRHALYRSDPSLQELHRKFPWILVWDDHEIANDGWRHGAENHATDGSEGGFVARKLAAIRAYYEWLPIREPLDGDRRRIYRSFDFGDLAQLVMLDTRVIARDEQLAYPDLLAVYQTAGADGSYPNDVTEDGRPRTLMGREQENWFAERMAGRQQIWQIVGQQILVHYQGALNFLGSDALTQAQKDLLILDLDRVLGPGGGLQYAQLGALGAPDPVATDAWTGYPSARNRFNAALAAARNPVVLAGDSHNGWAANLGVRTPGGFLPFGVELATPGVSSPGFEEFLFVGARALERLIRQSGRSSTLDQIVYANLEKRGFILVDVTPERVRTSWIYVDTVFEPTYTATVEKVLDVATDSRTLTRVDV